MNKAHIYVGYELSEDWENVVPHDYFDEHEENFIHLNMEDGEAILFAVEVMSVDCGEYAEMRDLSLDDGENELLNYFPSLFPKAVKNHMPRYFLAGRIC
jgi:hypothetical protein